MGTHTHTHRQVKMKAKAAIWVTLMQDKAQRGWPASPGAGRKAGAGSPFLLQEELTLQTP